MNNDVVTYKPDNYNPVLMEEYLFENTLQDSDGKDPTNLYFLIRPKEGMSIPHFHIVNILEVSDKEKYSKSILNVVFNLNVMHIGITNHG